MAAYKTVNRTSTIGAAISEAYGELQGLRDEMQEWRDNLEERFSQTSKYEAVSECVDQLDQVADDEPDVDEKIAKLALEYPEQVSTRKNRSPGRATRASNAGLILRAVIDVLEAHDASDEHQDLIDAMTEHADAVDGLEFPGMYG